MRAAIEQMTKPLMQIMRTSRGTISAGVTEGLNNKLKLTTRKAYGFRTFDAVKVALYHNLGALPEPKSTHEFC